MVEVEQSYDQEKLTEHEYDGIREYDNPPPFWMNLIFVGTVIFSAYYFLFFHLGSMGWTVADSFNSAVAENLRLRFSEIGELEANEPTIVEYMGKDDWLAIGNAVFQAQCKSCHGADGAGLIGPNLTDNNYKHAADLMGLARVIEKGAEAGAMPAWKSRLHPNEIVLVTAYVANLRGRNVAGPGDAVERRDGGYKEIPPWPTTVPDAPAKTAEDDTTVSASSKEPAGTPSSPVKKTDASDTTSAQSKSGEAPAEK